MFIIIFSLIVLLFSIIVHELAHGQVAFYLGDPTAKYAGRLTLNPLKHIDPIGSVVLPLFLVLTNSPFVIGWTKPVPINSYNFKNPRWDNLKVALSGPTSNFIIALFFGLLIRFIPLPFSLFRLFSIIAIYNIFWGLFNLIPIPPLDGSHVLFSFLPDSSTFQIKRFLQQYGLLLLLLFLFFGLNFLGPLASFLYSAITGQPRIIF